MAFGMRTTLSSNWRATAAVYCRVRPSGAALRPQSDSRSLPDLVLVKHLLSNGTLTKRSRRHSGTLAPKEVFWDAHYEMNLNISVCANLDG